MSLGHGASVVRSGLVLHLDAANVKSYPGSGTTWFDLSGNGNHFTLFNNPSHLNNSLSFNGTSQYSRSSSTLDLSPYDKITVEIVFRIRSSGLRGMAFEHSSNWNSNAGGFGLLTNSTGSINYVTNIHHTNHKSGKGRFNFSGIIGTNNVSVTTVWSRVADLTGRASYVNDVKTSVNDNTGNYTAFKNYHMYISCRGGSSIFGGHDVYQFRVYGVKLTAEEIRQNFEATRSRYGI